MSRVIDVAHPGRLNLMRTTVSRDRLRSPYEAARRSAYPAILSLLLMASACAERENQPAAQANHPVDTVVVATTGHARDSSAGAAGHERAVLTVEGMYCESCERTVAAMLRRSPGVHRAAVSVARGEAVVEYDPAVTSTPALVTVLERLGYRATIPPM